MHNIGPALSMAHSAPWDFAVGFADGSAVGPAVGSAVGDAVGLAVGAGVGSALGLPAPRLTLGLRARDYGVAKAGDLDGLGPRGVRGEACEEDRAQIHGYRESALTSSEYLLYRASARLTSGVSCSTARSRP